ncbi:Oxoglutarate/iron-dependent dioxygenase [Apiospora rasikravindrae]|uniref:Oxoglutarate/iron-dependent dioxygenase n=1 Tax=Apiospora rasikravindrae TaxID=990691 RepID=A0ABR1U050_9PEZI
MAAAVLNPPSRTTSEIPAYHQVPETQYELDWADLATLDLSKFDQPGGKEELSKQLFEAIQKIETKGFFYITNFGLSQEQVDQQFAIGKEVFKLSTEEKLKYRADLEHGGYNGYKPVGLREIRPGIFDNTEIYNIPKFIPELERTHPDVINANRRDIETFARHIHEEVVSKLLVLFARILELPDEEYFLRSHRYTERSDCHLRYMKYHRRTPEQNRALENVWVKGHTDFGSLTLLFRQPVAALQVRTPGTEGEGEGQSHSWKWVKPHPGSITVNIADSLEFLTNGFLKSSIHRVVAPPPDQTDIDRLGVLYFVRPEDSLELKPVESKVLVRLGYNKSTDRSAVGITAGEWVKARVASGVSRGKQPRSDVSEQHILGGKSAKYYD